MVPNLVKVNSGANAFEEMCRIVELIGFPPYAPRFQGECPHCQDIDALTWNSWGGGLRGIELWVYAWPRAISRRVLVSKAGTIDLDALRAKFEALLPLAQAEEAKRLAQNAQEESNRSLAREAGLGKDLARFSLQGHDEEFYLVLDGLTKEQVLAIGRALKGGV